MRKGAQNIHFIADEANNRLWIDVGGSGHSRDAILLGDIAAGKNDVIISGDIRFNDVNLVRAVGTNPTCPAGTGNFLMREWNARTCNSGIGGSLGICTTGSGWYVNAPTCRVLSGVEELA